MTDEQKRAEVRAMYPGPKWAKRVDNMPDAQVFAIWAKNQTSKPKVEPDAEVDPPIPF